VPYVSGKSVVASKCWTVWYGVGGIHIGFFYFISSYISQTAHSTVVYVAATYLKLLHSDSASDSASGPASASMVSTIGSSGGTYEV
jgi:hypothetical protein